MKRLFFGVVTALGIVGLASAAPARTSPPNVVLFVADDLGYGDVGFHGGPGATPALDALAKDGVDLTTVYAHPGSGRSRAALLTGRWPHRYAVGPKTGLDLGEHTLAEALKAAGYSTALVGSWGLGESAPALLPTARGYDHHYGPRGDTLDPHSHEKTDGTYDWWRDGEPALDDGFSSTLLGKEAARIVREHDGGPLFLHVSFTTPKQPLSAPPRLQKRWIGEPNPDRRAYLAMVVALDEAVAEVVGALDARGWRENTLVLVVGDGGGNEKDGALNDPLRGGAGEPGLYEGAVRVPALASWPGHLTPGKRDTPLHLVDVFPTVAGLAHASAGPARLDGVDAWGMLSTGAAIPARFLPLSVTSERLVVRDGAWKLIASRTADEAELYDLAADPAEATDLAAEKPDVVARLRARGEAAAAEAPAEATPAAAAPETTRNIP